MNEISQTKDSIEKLADLDFSYYDRAIDEKIKEIKADKEQKSKIEELKIEDYEKEIVGVDFNEDELFKEELFS